MTKRTGYPSVDKIHLAGIPDEKLHPNIQPYSMYAIFSQINEGRMDEVVLEQNGKTWTKREIRNDATMFADALLNAGVMPHDTIAIALPNSYEGIIITLGANAIGVKVAYLNPELSKDEQLQLVNERDYKMLFGGGDMDFYYKFIKRNEEAFHKNDRCTVKPYPQTLDMIQQYSVSEEVAIYLQTSGSTSGVPKILPFTNRAIFASLMYIANSTGTKTNDESVNSVLCIIPYRLPYGWMTIFINLIAGNKVILAPGATPHDIGEYYKLKPSYIYGTPVIFRTFMEETPEDADLSSITAFFCSGFAIPEEWYQEGRKYFAKHGNMKAEIRNNYGIGEGLCIGTASDGIEHKPGTCGKFYVGPEWKIVDDDYFEVKYDEVGELIVAAESLCEGYLGDEEATEVAFVDIAGKIYYSTGDYVKLSEDGYVTFVGRKKRFYQPKGATDKVNCETIEQAILKSHRAKRCAVVIYEGEDGFETSCAFVELKHPKDSHEGWLDYKRMYEQLLDGGGLLPYQMPSKIIAIDEIPMMKSGKPDYANLRKILNEMLS